MLSLAIWSTARVMRSVSWPWRLRWTCRQVATAPATRMRPPKACSRVARVSFCRRACACCKVIRVWTSGTPRRSAPDRFGCSNSGMKIKAPNAKRTARATRIPARQLGGHLIDFLLRGLRINGPRPAACSWRCPAAWLVAWLVAAATAIMSYEPRWSDPGQRVNVTLVAQDQEVEELPEEQLWV